MSNPLAFLNGTLIPADHAALPFHDAGFVLGATVTDLVRTFHHRLYRLDEHLARFRQSCDLCRIPQLRSNNELKSIAEELVEHNAASLPADGDLALVMFATPGPIGYLAGLPGGLGDGPPTLGMHTFTLPFVRYQRMFREGAHLVALPDQSRSPVDPRAKQRSRMHWWLAEQAAHDIDPVSSALGARPSGHLTETAAANFLIVKNGAVISPRKGTILNGVSLGVVRELCSELGIPFAKRSFKVQDVFSADEALLTSTPYCVAGVGHFNRTPIPWPGPIWKRLLEAWSERVQLDIAGQILAAR